MTDDDDVLLKVMCVFPFKVISVCAGQSWIHLEDLRGWGNPPSPNLGKFGPVRASCSAIPNAACSPKSNHGISEQIRGEATLDNNISGLPVRLLWVPETQESTLGHPCLTSILNSSPSGKKSEKFHKIISEQKCRPQTFLKSENKFLKKKKI